jgi:hypothetical protein
MLVVASNSLATEGGGGAKSTTSTRNSVATTRGELAQLFTLAPELPDLAFYISEHSEEAIPKGRVIWLCPRSSAMMGGTIPPCRCTTSFNKKI